MARPKTAGPLNRQQFVIALFRCAEAFGFRPSVRTMAAMLREDFGIHIEQATLLRILSPFLRAARNGFHAQIGELTNFRNVSEIRRNGFPSSAKHFEKNPKRLSDLSTSLINSLSSSPSLSTPPYGPPYGDGPKLNDEQVAAEQAELAARFRTARELLAETERRNRLSANGKPAIEPTEAPPTGGGTE